MQPATARLLTLADADAAAEVQASAFQTDPFWQYIVPDDAKRAKLLRQTFRPVIRLAILNEQAYGVGDPVEGFAAWGKPNQKTSVSAVIRSGLMLQVFNIAFIRLLPKAVKVFGKFDEMQKKYAPDPHYYLQTISVTPAAQGKGLASKLIRPILVEADAAHLGTYTETTTPSNVSLYEYYGFKVLEEYRLPDAGLTLWSFYRAPL